MKGGTAINLFLRDMPRLSVDLDLVYPDHQPSRDEALQSLSEFLGSIEAELSELGFSSETGASSQGDEVKLFVEKDRTRIKVEVNHVFRLDGNGSSCFDSIIILCDKHSADDLTPPETRDCRSPQSRPPGCSESR